MIDNHLYDIDVVITPTGLRGTPEPRRGDGMNRQAVKQVGRTAC